MMRRVVGALAMLAVSGVAKADDYYPQDIRMLNLDVRACVQEAGIEYGIAPEILWKIIRAESDGNVSAVNVDGRGYWGLPLRDAIELVYRALREGKHADVGLMQVNTIHMSELGVSDVGVLFDPCYNIKAGAYLLAKAIRKLGYTWRAIGAYNVGVSGITGKSRYKERYVRRGVRYARKVSRMSSKPFKVWVPVEVLDLAEKEEAHAANYKVN